MVKGDIGLMIRSQCEKNKGSSPDDVGEMTEGLDNE